MNRIYRNTVVWAHGDECRGDGSCKHGSVSKAAIVVFICVLGLFAPSSVRAQARGDLLNWSTNGPIPASTPQLQNPSYLLSLESVQELALELRRGPRDSAYIETALDGTAASLADLVATRLLSKAGDLYALGFPLLTTEDLSTVKDISERFGRDLADVYLRRRTEIEGILTRYPMKQIDQRMLAYVLLGCFSLDWDGLDITQEKGYRTPFLTEGVGFVHWATQQQPPDFLKGVYWGSHNESLDNDIVLTSFGDHTAPMRIAFPDLYWRLSQAFPDVMWQAALSYGVEVPEELRSPILRIARRVFRELAYRAADVMVALREGEKTADEIGAALGSEPGETRELLALLEAVQYVQQESDRYRAAIPILLEEDRPLVQDLLGLSAELITTWLEENYEPLKAEFMRTTPVGHAVPFEDTFYYVWHYVFGTANRILVEVGMFADPYGADRKHQGYIPVVWHRSVRSE